jgi:hypothetical protein
MKSKKLSWYQTGIISLIGIFLLGNWAIDKEVVRRDLRYININFPKNIRHKGISTEFDLTVIDEVKKKKQLKISIDSLTQIDSMIKEYKIKYDTTHALMVSWNDSTHLQKIISILDVVEKHNLKRYAIIPNENQMIIDFYFPKPTLQEEELRKFNSGSCIPFYYPEPTKTFQQNFDMIFKNYIWVWILFGALTTCTFWKIKRQ